MHNTLYRAGYFRTFKFADKEVDLRLLLRIASVMLGIASIFALVYSGWLFGAVSILAVTTWFSANVMVSRSTKGVQSAARWRAYEQYLRNVGDYSEAANKHTGWETALTYAVALGAEEAYMSSLRQSDINAPSWYRPDSRKPQGDDSKPSISSGPTSDGNVETDSTSIYNLKNLDAVSQGLMNFVSFAKVKVRKNPKRRRYGSFPTSSREVAGFIGSLLIQFVLLLIVGIITDGDVSDLTRSRKHSRY